MQYPNSRGITGGNWVANMILKDSDINYLSEATYSNFLISQLSKLPANINDYGGDVVISGMDLTVSSGLTAVLSSGVAVGLSGSYLNSSGDWGFLPTPDEAFVVIISDDVVIAFNAADPSSSRIDLVEIRPVRITYNPESRQFKDPITGLVTAYTQDTRVEYSYEFQTKTGVPGSGTCSLTTEGWIKLAEVNISAGSTTINSISGIGSDPGPGWWSTEAYKTARLYNSEWGVRVASGSSIVDLQKKIDAIPKNLDGGWLYIEPEGSSPVWDSVLSLKDFKNGTVQLNSYYYTGEISVTSSQFLLVDSLDDFDVRVTLDFTLAPNTGFASVDVKNSNKAFINIVATTTSLDFTNSYLVKLDNVVNSGLQILATKTTGLGDMVILASLCNNIYLAEGCGTNWDYFIQFDNCVYAELNKGLTSTIAHMLCNNSAMAIKTPEDIDYFDIRVPVTTQNFDPYSATGLILDIIKGYPKNLNIRFIIDFDATLVYNDIINSSIKGRTGFTRFEPTIPVNYYIEAEDILSQLFEITNSSEVYFNSNITIINNGITDYVVKIDNSTVTLLCDFKQEEAYVGAPVPSAIYNIYATKSNLKLSYSAISIIDGSITTDIDLTECRALVVGVIESSGFSFSLVTKYSHVAIASNTFTGTTSHTLSTVVV